MTFKKVDVNQSEIVRGLRELGFSVTDLHTLGHGVPDLLVAIARINFLVEIKADSKKHVTPDQVEWMGFWQGNFIVGWNLYQIVQHAYDYIKLFGMENHADALHIKEWLDTQNIKEI